MTDVGDLAKVTEGAHWGCSIEKLRPSSYLALYSEVELAGYQCDWVWQSLGPGCGGPIVRLERYGRGKWFC
jgi:hypothetical protein